jgi:hypothetical protein
MKSPSKMWVKVRVPKQRAYEANTKPSGPANWHKLRVMIGERSYPKKWFRYARHPSADGTAVMNRWYRILRS